MVSLVPGAPLASMILVLLLAPFGYLSSTSLVPSMVPNSLFLDYQVPLLGLEARLSDSFVTSDGFSSIYPLISLKKDVYSSTVSADTACVSQSHLQLAALVQVSKAVPLVEGCGRRVLRHFKCCNIVTP
ncbi:hypothetical protein SUGI_0489170 [Cryptomeria japonica]|nr:hypothetical protein SUGI_0489170 [Cryptomeria japonica]